MKMKSGPTLIDTLYRLSFDREPVPGWTSNAVMRERLVAARRFVLDASMSRFLADLSVTCFKSGLPATHGAVEQLRISARSPHKVVWIEYNLREELGRLRQLIPDEAFVSPPEPAEAPSREGWLIEQHPQLDYAFRMHVFSEAPNEPDSRGYDAWTFPFCFGWTVNDSPLPWQRNNTGGHTAATFVGVKNYVSPYLDVIHSDLISWPMGASPREVKLMHDLLSEWGGIMRRTWALLTTINDLPMLATDVRQSKGFVARGSYRRFLDHRVIRLNIPGKANTIKVARQLVAIARRRAHQVRGHWRQDWRHPGNRQCQHQWDTENRCVTCLGHRLWIHEHQRGDASQGFVTHDYNLTHDQA
jgi:hypothetical protein